jgi:hypothetical protein
MVRSWIAKVGENGPAPSGGITRASILIICHRNLRAVEEAAAANKLRTVRSFYGKAHRPVSLGAMKQDIARVDVRLNSFDMRFLASSGGLAVCCALALC